jgi:hypothetical protein
LSTKFLENWKLQTAGMRTLIDHGSGREVSLPSLTGHGEVLTTALKIYSVEARHAAEVRHLRAKKAWVGAFDKPMTKEQVLAVAKPFFVH